MFSNKNSMSARRGATAAPAPATLSPRFARLVRESLWFAVVALCAYAALILASYSPGDPAWSYSGDGAPLRNRGGAIGAWLADLLLYLFGLSAWWLVVAGMAITVATFRRIAHPELESDHPRWLGGIGFVRAARRERRDRGIALLEEHRCAAARPGRRDRLVARLAAHARARRQRRDAAAGRRVPRRLLALLRTVVAQADGAHRRRARRRGGMVPSQARGARGPADRRAGDARARGDRRAVARERASSASASSSCRRRRRRRDRSASSRKSSGRSSPTCPIRRCRRCRCSRKRRPPASTSAAETLEFTSRLIERKLADFGVAAKVLAAYPGPVITRYEIEPAVGVKGSQIVNLVKDLARALSVVSIRVVETIPGKSCMALELPNAKRQIVRLVEILASTTYHDAAREALARARQGHRRQAGRRRPRAHAAPAGRRHDRLGQVGRGQRDDPVAALQGRAARRAPDPDRSRRCSSCRCTRASRTCSRPSSPT